MPNIRETDCLFRVADTGDFVSISIEPRAGGWQMQLNLTPDRTSVDEAKALARRLSQIVSSVTAQPNDPFRWIETPGSETRQ